MHNLLTFLCKREFVLTFCCLAMFVVSLLADHAGQSSKFSKGELCRGIQPHNNTRNAFIDAIEA